MAFDYLRRLNQLIGYQADDAERTATRPARRRLQRLHRGGLLVITALPVLPMSAFVYRERVDLDKLTAALCLLASVVSGLFKGVALHWHRVRIGRLLADGDRTVARRRHRTRHYGRMDRVGNRLVGLFCVTGLFTMVLLLAGPVLANGVRAVRGTLRPEMWVQPVPMVLPYDSSTSPTYELSYLLSGGACCLTALYLIVTAGLYVCLLTHYYAGLMDMRDMVGQLDDAFHRRDSAAYDARRDARTQCQIRRQLRQCFRHHRHLMSQIDDLAIVFGPIIFAQFFFSVCLLGVVVFQIQFGTPTFDRQAANLVMGFGFLNELFIYCFFGNELALQEQHVATAAAHTQWYRVAPDSLFAIWMLIRRNQTGRTRIHGFGLIAASLDTYKAVLNMIGSLLAFLRSMV